MPTYEVVERHHIRIGAPADITFAAACDVDFQQSALIRAIFKGRELMLGAAPDVSERPRGLLALTTSLGWGVLAEVPDREVVVGAVTQPWKANVVFRALPPDAFAAFNEPDYVKIVWTLRADPIGAGQSIARTETRVMTTDAARTEEVPPILVTCLAWHRDHSASGLDAGESRGRTPSRARRSHPRTGSIWCRPATSIRNADGCAQHSTLVVAKGSTSGSDFAAAFTEHIDGHTDRRSGSAT